MLVEGGVNDRMAESFSTPSSISPPAGATSNTLPLGPEGGGDRAEEFYLSISSQPSAYVYPDESFEVAFTLESFKVSPTSSPPPDVRIYVELVPDNGATITLNVLEEPRLSLTRRSGRTKCCIQSSQPIGKDQIRGKLRFTATGIAGCTTHYITLVRAKLQVSVGEDWTNIWYKDEGGRDKCIEAIVSAYDKQNDEIHEALHLDIKLCYDATDSPPVTNQDILKRLGPDKGLQIDQETGKAKIRFRVEDVSKNHQGQNFVLLVSVAQSSGGGIAPAKTPPVNVRSKRNKRQRAGSVRGSAQDLSQADSGTALAGPPVHRSYASNEQLREAVSDVIRWTEEVVSGMYHIQWRVMGYASNADGSVDYNRPYHNMQNPNPVVDRLLALYNQSTRENIRYLQHTIVDAPGEPYSVARSPPVHPSMVPPAAAAAPPPPPPHPSDVMGANRGPHGVDQYGMPHSTMPIHSDTYPETPTVQQYPQHAHHQEYYPPPHASAKPAGHHERMEPHPLSAHSPRRSSSPTVDRESEVEYVLARQYKSLRTGQRLGFPAYTVEREILGFYRDSSRNAGLRQFIPISDQDFGPSEKHQAKKILDEAIGSNSRAVQSVKDCGSIASVLDRCLVYEFSKDIGGGSK